MSTSIYILDDDVYFGKCLKKHLEKTADEVRYFKTERNFIKSLSRGPNLLILDYNLSRTTGLEILQEIRKEGIGTEFIMVSSQYDESTMTDAFNNGALGYFDKNAETFSTVRKAIDKIRALTADFSMPVNKVQLQTIFHPWMSR